MKSLVLKHSVVIAGHKTSVSLEDAFWKALKEIATLRDMALSDLVGSIDVGREHANLSSAIRLFILDFYRTQFGEKTAVRDVSREEGALRALPTPGLAKPRRHDPAYYRPAHLPAL
jgi:predicted DNA-binding ribbon-helix-helix protein